MSGQATLDTGNKNGWIYRSAPFRWWLWANRRFPGQLKWWDKCHPFLLFAIIMNNWWRGSRSLRHSFRVSLSYPIRAKTNGGRGIIDLVRQFRYAGSFLLNKSTTTPILFMKKKKMQSPFRFLNTLETTKQTGIVTKWKAGGETSGSTQSRLFRF